ncbi:hypothetical protein J2S30_000866 [Herbaspirillum rubrisubalbicans]|nr:hypothetical protein [Herbaspirillum rubrisubalbicans]
MGIPQPKTKLAIATADILTFPKPLSPVNTAITPFNKPFESNQTSAR